MKSKINIKSILIVAIIGIVSLVYFNPSFAANTAKVNVEAANLRKEADANSEILDQLSQDQEVEVLEKLDGWYKIKYKNLQGYLRQDLLNVEEAQPAQNVQVENTTVSTNTQTENTEVTKQEEQQPATEAEVKTEDVTGMYICKDKVDLKIMPLILGHNIKEINKDTTVNVLEINNKWALVESGTNRGWVLASKLEKASAEQKPEEKVEEKQEEQKEEQSKQEEQQEVTKYINSEVVNLRQGEGTSTESIARLSKGTQVTVTSENNGWSKVKVNSKEGYILSTLLSDRKPEVTTSRNVEQPRNETIKEETSEPVEATPAASGRGQEVCNYAKQYLGCSYVYGGTTPNGFDCSGFTQYVYKHFGVTLNRTAEAQASNGTAVSKSNLRAGDLLIFTHHAGIYLGDGTFIHAGNSRTGVIITSLSDSYYTRNYITARRIFN